jgi:hypothetical protein
MDWALWFMPIIPTTQEAKVGGLQPKALSKEGHA